MDGQTLTFRLVGVNNQNFLMADEQTGSWWQQVTGEAIQGPMRGKRLERVPSDEVRFAVWRHEHPTTTVLARQAEHEDRYLKDGWADRVAAIEAPFAEANRGGPLADRDLVVGITVAGESKAYPFETLKEQSPIADFVGGVPVVVVLDADGRSARAFDRRIEGRTLELFRVPNSDPVTMVDAESGSTWSFAGVAVDGEQSGTALARIQTLSSFWFDWRNQNVGTTVFRVGL